MKVRTVLAGAVFTVLAGGAFVYGVYRHSYPLGFEHRCDAGLWFALWQYADEHGGAFPSGEATPEASISLIHSLDQYREESPYLLHRRDVPVTLVRQLLESGQLLGPDTCGWDYVEGLRQDSNTRLALFWDKEGLGHNGERLSGGGHIVTYVSGSCEHIPASRWDGFLQEQQRLLTEERSQRTQAKREHKNGPPQTPPSASQREG